MQKCDLFGWPVELDAELTRAWYADATPWPCDCGHCRNFLALAQAGQLPKPLPDTLARLGIPPEKATYVCEIYPDGDGHHYQFSYRIAGNILAEAAEPSHSWVRCGHETYPHGAPDFPQPHFDLEFWLTLPWVLEEKA